MKIKSAGRIMFFYFLSFALPTVIILLALLGLRVSPFGDKTLAISDGNALYVNFLAFVGRFAKGMETFTYSFEKGLGGNMMDSWAWFLLNPVFALFAFFDIMNYPTAYTIVSVLNFSVCGVTMYILLADLYGHKLSNLIFSTSYALIGFNVANVFQLNFFTGVPMLPLVVLGLRKIFQGKSPLVYILSLAYALFTNFYFGFILCVASVLVFLTVFIVERRELKGKKTIVFKYILSSGLAGLMSIMIWLPALLALKGGRLDQISLADYSFRENMPFLEMASKLFTGANTASQLVNGLPNIFVGILPLFFVVLFFLNKEINNSKKIEAGVLLGVYLISFYIVAFNLVMHGGTRTNWFNYRDSFVFSFILLLIAAQQWHVMETTPAPLFKRALAILFVSAILVFSKSYEYVFGGEILLDFALLVVILLAYVMHRKDPAKNPLRLFTMIAIILVSGNLYANYMISTSNIMEWGIKESEYQSTVLTVDALIQGVTNADKEFYRMEVEQQRSGTTGNDSMLYGYNGVGHGGSDAKNSVRTALSKLGIHRFDMRNFYNSGTPASTDTLLGLRYLVAKNNLIEEKGYQKRITLGDTSLYQNHEALSIAVLSDPSIVSVETDMEDVFENLNKAWAGLSGTDKAVFVEESDITFSSHNRIDPLELSRDEAASILEKREEEAKAAMESAGSAESMESMESAESMELMENAESKVDEAGASGKSESLGLGDSNSQGMRGTLREKPVNLSYIMFTWVAKRDGAVYTYNRAAMTDTSGSATPTLNYEGYYHEGDTVTGYIPVNGDYVSQFVLENMAGMFRAAYEDKDVLSELSEKVRSYPTIIEKISDDHLIGSFTAEENQLLLFTIPYDEGWTLKIDGVETPYEMVLDVFMAAEVSEGEHTFELTFVPEGLRLASRISLASAAVCLVYVVGDSLIRRRREKNAVLEIMRREEIRKEKNQEEIQDDKNLAQGEEKENGDVQQNQE